MNNIKYALAFILAGSLTVAAAPPSAPSVPQSVPSVAPKPCAKTYDINEIVSKLNDGFPAQLKDCSSKTNEVIAAKKKDKKDKRDPKVFMKQCATDGVKKELPEGFPGTNKVVGLVEKLVQSNTADGTNIDGFLSDVKKSLGPDECVVESKPEPVLPVVPPPPPTPDFVTPPPPKESASSVQNSAGYLGFRAGINFSHLSATSYTTSNPPKKVNGTYDDVLGFQVGMVVDMAPTDLFHIQPGIMYIQKGTENNGISVTAHYFEVPLLFALKFSIFDIKVGPYLGPYLDIYFGSSKDDVFAEDIGLNLGLGFDIDMFYIGAFYDYGLVNISSNKHYVLNNRTLGLNLGVNL